MTIRAQLGGAGYGYHHLTSLWPDIIITTTIHTCSRNDNNNGGNVPTKVSTAARPSCRLTFRLPSAPPSEEIRRWPG